MSYIGNQPVLNTSEFREEFAVTSTQTVFNTGGFTASSDSATLEVLRNGVLLGTADYTLGSDASTVTLANAAVNGDIIVIKGRRELTNGVQVTERRHEHTIASGETTVTFPYPLTVSQTDVYLNGVKLGSSDFSINSSTRVVSFTTNPAVGDLVAIVSREPALTANSSLPVVDATGTNVLSESGGVVTLTADEANVGSNALVVDSSGKVGVGLSSPSTLVEAQSTDARITLTHTGGNSLQLYQQSVSSYIITDSDLNIYTNGSTRMSIDSSGNLLVETDDIDAGIGDTSGTDTQASYRPTQGYRQKNGTNFYNRTSTGDFYRFRYQGSQVGSISIGTTATGFNTSSDYRLKENITEITDGINRVKQLNPSRFNFISDPDIIVDGFLAHEVQGIVPEAVSGEKDAVDSDGKPEYQGVDYGRITPLLTAALKEAIAKIEMLETRIAVLEAK